MKKYLISFLPFFFTLEIFAQKMPSGLAIYSCPTGAIDLEIASGDSNTPIPNNIEESIGAATVANKNDSDADGWIDNIDPWVFSTGVDGVGIGGGQDFDPDLMKLTMYKPIGCISNQFVKLNVIKGSVRFYQTHSKQGGIDKLEFKCKDLPKDIYVEAIDNSVTIRDIEIEMKYNSLTDKVRATAVWVKHERTWTTWCPTNNSSCNQATDNPKPKEGVLTNLDDVQTGNVISDRISKDGSRFGHGYHNVDNNGIRDENYGGRILFEFGIFPNLLPSEYFDLGISFDCTRRRNSRVLLSSHGKKPMTTDIVPFPNVEDSANDDQSSTGEDNIPLNGLLYSWDAPAMPLYINGNYSFKAVKSTFEEFVRVGIWNTIPTNGTGLLGTRVSEKVPWHNVFYTKSGSNHILEPDLTTVSVSSVIEKAGSSGNSGTGTCDIQLQGNPITEGYQFEYNSAGTWEINGVSLTQNPIGTWVFSNSNIKVTITKGAIAFYKDDKFEFSVFVSNKKLNETSLGSFNDVNSDF